MSRAPVAVVDVAPRTGPQPAEANAPEWLVPSEAVTEWLALSAALVDLAPGLPPCASADAESWWLPTSPSRTAEAVAACWACPVRVECAAYARAGREMFGIWGGETPADRGMARSGKRRAS